MKDAIIIAFMCVGIGWDAYTLSALRTPAPTPVDRTQEEIDALVDHYVMTKEHLW